MAVFKQSQKELDRRVGKRRVEPKLIYTVTLRWAMRIFAIHGYLEIAIRSTLTQVTVNLCKNVVNWTLTFTLSLPKRNFDAKSLKRTKSEYPRRTAASAESAEEIEHRDAESAWCSKLECAHFGSLIEVLKLRTRANLDTRRAVLLDGWNRRLEAREKEKIEGQMNQGQMSKLWTFSPWNKLTNVG